MTTETEDGIRPLSFMSYATGLRLHLIRFSFKPSIRQAVSNRFS